MKTDRIHSDPVWRGTEKVLSRPELIVLQRPRLGASGPEPGAPLSAGVLPGVGVRGAALCLFGSGLCALIYQTVWLREFRLVFGASTAASAAVLAIFMGGLGAGSLLLGRRVDGLGNPLRFYGKLEFVIALSAALTPGLVWGVRHIYFALGGTIALGPWLGTGLRVVLSTLVLIVPTFLMGGTLPAVVRSLQSDGDPCRRRVALVYGANALGAVTGALLSTFFLVEHLGNRLTLWAACAVNVMVALVALRLALGRDRGAMSGHLAEIDEAGESPVGTGAPLAQARFALVAAAVSGFVFLLMELVWYRMLGPLLGGSTFTFGLILAVALLGIALGSFVYSWGREERAATLAGFALVCALEACCVALPLALGDRLAMLAILLQPLGAIGFAARVATWSLMTCLVVLPAALVAGYQFPMLIALLGRGRRAVGWHTGLAYAWNTAGAIAGSLAGGFGMLPLLTAPGAWRVAGFVLIALAGNALALAWLARFSDGTAGTAARRWDHGPGAMSRGDGLLSRRGAAFGRLAAPVLASAAAVWLLMAIGPTSVWRHSPIGAGRVHVQNEPSLNGFKDFIHQRRRSLYWEAEGVESSVGLTRDNGFAFVVNGKVDGNARSDAGTQVFCGLLPALVHPAPRHALVVGLGTGTTAGWLADVPGLERVDVVELEPAMRMVAQFCEPVNRRVLANPKVHLWFGDAREAMLAGKEQYDVIASEPSNPYRAGVASLFTREFYQAVARRLRPQGIFAQWVQAYEVDGATVCSVYATLGSVFGSIETWKTEDGDLLFLAAREPMAYDVPEIRRRVQVEPWRSALAWVWRTRSAEGVFAHHMANGEFARGMAAAGVELNTDDRTGLEFAFSRTVGQHMTGFDINQLNAMARQRGCAGPSLQGGNLNVQRVADERMSSLAAEGQWNIEVESDSAAFRTRTQAKSAFGRGEFVAAAQAWLKQSEEPEDLTEMLLVALGLALQGDGRALPCIERLRAWVPLEADAVEAQLLWRQGRAREAMVKADQALQGYHTDPWPTKKVMELLLGEAKGTAKQPGQEAYAVQLLNTLRSSFAVSLLEDDRTQCRLDLANLLGRAQAIREIVSGMEPHVPWTRSFLELRTRIYALTGDAQSVVAAADLVRFDAREALPFLFNVDQAWAARPGLPGTVERVQARERKPGP